MSSSEEEKEDNMQLILSAVGLGISSLIIVIFLVVTNLCIYRKDPNYFLFKPTMYEPINYIYSFFVFFYVATFNLLVATLNYFLEKNIVAIIIILIVFAIYMASIISLVMLEEEKK